MYINELEVAFHVGGHAFGVACELFADVFFEGCSPPTPHFLNLGVRVP